MSRAWAIKIHLAMALIKAHAHFAPVPVARLDYSQYSTAIELKAMTFRPLSAFPLYILNQIRQPHQPFPPSIYSLPSF
jgi:hypothetical protein